MKAYQKDWGVCHILDWRVGVPVTILEIKKEPFFLRLSVDLPSWFFFDLQPIANSRRVDIHSRNHSNFEMMGVNVAYMSLYFLPFRSWTKTKKQGNMILENAGVSVRKLVKEQAHEFCLLKVASE